MPESAQKSVWSYAFENGIRPQLESAASKGAQLEDIAASKERFVTSMLGKPQKSSAEPTVQQPFPGQETANTAGDFIKSLVAGTAGGVRQAAEAVTPGPPIMSPMTLGSMPPVNIPKQNAVTNTVSAATHPVESMYDTAALSSPDAASVGAGIGHTVPSLLAYESGAGVVPTLESKAGLLMRGVQQLTRTAAGTAAMNTVTPEDTSSFKFGAQVLGFSIVDALTHHVLNSKTAKAVSGATGKVGATDVSTPVMTQARSVIDTVRTFLGKKGLPLNKSTLQVFNEAFMKKLSVENPEAFARIAGGKSTVEAELSPQKIADITNKVSEEQAAENIATKANAKTAEVASKQQVQAAEGIAKAQAKAQKIVDRQAQAAESKRFQRELSAYAKNTGAVPASDSEAFQRLQKGASAKDLLAEQKATVVGKLADVKSIQDAVAMTTEQPALHEIMQDMHTIVPLNESRQGLAESYLVPKVETPVKPLASSAASVPAQPPKVSSAASVASPTAFEKLGIKVDPASWKTPEDVTNGKKQAILALQAEGLKRATDIANGLKAGTITVPASDAMQAQLKNDVTQALRSIQKIKTPSVSRAARDRVRKGAEAFEAKRVVGEQQTAAQATGRTVGSTTPSEADAIHEIDELVRKGFRSLNAEKMAKDILKESDRLRLDNASKLQWLQDAFAELTKKGSK